MLAGLGRDSMRLIWRSADLARTFFPLKYPSKRERVIVKTTTCVLSETKRLKNEEIEKDPSISVNRG